MFDKVKSAIASAKAAVNDAVNEEIKARRFNALKALAGVDTKLAKAEEQLETAVKRSEPRVKKAKKAKTEKK